jgi:hypothetical protein
MAMKDNSRLLQPLGWFSTLRIAQSLDGSARIGAHNGIVRDW